MNVWVATGKINCVCKRYDLYTHWISKVQHKSVHSNTVEPPKNHVTGCPWLPGTPQSSEVPHISRGWSCS